MVSHSVGPSPSSSLPSNIWAKFLYQVPSFFTDLHIYMLTEANKTIPATCCISCVLYLLIICTEAAVESKIQYSSTTRAFTALGSMAVSLAVYSLLSTISSQKIMTPLFHSFPHIPNRTMSLVVSFWWSLSRVCWSCRPMHRSLYEKSYWYSTNIHWDEKEIKEKRITHCCLEKSHDTVERL